MSARIQVMIVLSAVIVLCAAASGTACAASQEYVKASGTAMSYTVSVVVENRHGSGFVIKEGREYYVVTHLGIMGKVQNVTVETSDGKEYKAELRGSSPGAGLAVLRLLDVKGSLTAAKLGKSDKLEIGEKVLAVGRPQGRGFCVTAGIVSGLRAGDAGDGKDLHYIQTDAAINVGQTGGPLVNLDGEVIGMCVVYGPRVKGRPRSSIAGGLNFAIPIDVVQDAVREVIRLGGVLATLRDFGFSGLQDVSRISMEKFRLLRKEGALVRSVRKDSPVALAGIKGGDVILEFDGKTVKDAGHLKNLVESTPVGSKVSVRYVGIREGKPKADKTTIELPEPEDDDISHDRPAEEPGVVQAGGPVSGMEHEAVLLASASGEAAEYVNPVVRAASSVVQIGGGASAVLLFKDFRSGDSTVRYLVTAAHLLGRSKTVKVVFYREADGKLEPVGVEGEVVGRDAKSDIAVIKVAVKGGPDPIKCADASKVEYGTEVLAIGNGMGFTPTVTAGIISMKEQRPRDGFVRGFYTTTARVVGSNDGGAVVDPAGRLVGICTAAGGGFDKTGMSFVIPADMVRDIARRIIIHGKAKSGFLGLDAVRNLSRQEMKEKKMRHGVMVLKVVESSPADRGGLKEGQIIVRFDGDRVRNVEHLKVLVEAAQVDKETSVVIIDTDGERKTVVVEISERE